MGTNKNNIRSWLLAKLAERRMSTSRLTLMTGNRITNATLFRWYNGTFIPTPEKLSLVCETLSGLPILEEGKPPRFEEVLLREGLAQLNEND